MRYEKPPLTFSQQADLLIDRGLIADKATLIERLKAVSYYRLSGYWHPFRNTDNSFKTGTTLEKIWKRYTFDRQLRLFVIDAIERAEISIRTSLIYHLSHAHGPFAYTEHTCLPNITSETHDDFLKKITNETEHSQEVFVIHFKDKYGDYHSRLPLWMVSEVMTFGMLLTLFRGVATSIKQTIAGEYKISDRVLESWLRALNGVRNICAHHGRLWNRELGYKPMIPKRNKHPEWHEPVDISNNRVFAILTILKYFMNLIAPQSKWTERFEHLLIEYPEIPLLPMGFPTNWRECSIWKGGV